MSDDYSSLGFETVSVDDLTEYRAKGLHLRHVRTGAEVYKVHAEDDENLFAFSFSTPPHDHTGTPHILEHAVLCGSRQYPLKDPFLVLLKGSTHTFLNAMTYPDKTVYPAASMVKADFINLFRVYGDAVFFPNLKKEAFEQEGHRLELVDGDSLVRSGIVLNEMKGNYSSPEAVAGDWAMRSLFPDTPYRWDSGGDPQCIPELSYESLKKFHETYYHPSNVRIFLYGNHSLIEVLTILDSEFLAGFTSQDISSQIPLQKPWLAPRRMTAYWPSVPGQSVKNKSIISINWLWGDSSDSRQVLEARILSNILLGHSGAVLHKAVVESGLGEDISQISGLESHLRQMVFTIALRGTDPDKTADFEELITNTLRDSVKGLNPELIEGALRNVEFHAREIRGGTPFGLRLMERGLRSWMHGGTPSEGLIFDEPMKNLRHRLKEGYFENLIGQNLLDNPHRCTLLTSPDSGLGERRDKEDKARLKKIQSQMKPEDLQMLRDSNKRLARYQEEADSPEALSRIPFLLPEDLPREVVKIPLDCGRSGEIDWYCHDTFTNGVSYLGLVFDLRELEAELQPWMPLFGRTLTDIGLLGLSYEDLAIQLALKTGGLGCSLEALPLHQNVGTGMSCHLIIHLKALSDQWDDALEIILRLLQSVDFSNEKRIDNLIMELRNDYRSAIIPSGSMFASLRASAKHSMAASWEDRWHGIGQLHFLQALAENKNRVELAVEALKKIYNRVLRQDNLAIVVTTDRGKSPSILENSLEMTKNISKENLLSKKSSSSFPDPQLFRHTTMGESLSTASAVSFSALSLPAPIIGSAEHARASLLSHLLRTGYLWEKIRMKGGAYGAHASISNLEGTFNFTTYRDPLIAESLDAFQDSLKWGSDLDKDTLKIAIIGAVGKELRPLGPGQRGMLAFRRKLCGIDDVMRQMKRDTQLSATTAHIKATAEDLLGKWDRRSITVIAGEKDLTLASQTHPELNESRLVLHLA